MTGRTVLDEIAALIEKVLDGYDPTGAEITMGTSFQQDLGFESVDVVVLGGHLADLYGDAINFPKYLNELDLDQIIALTVGDLVEYVESCLVTRG
ncbi:acyl carrier protein [Streptomyces sp. NPDC093094]|uniref:acyl carrier protein n=1 Tax=Streptomyces sp. NPDC093094 TaxID=3366026 RepID=UPI00382128B2